MNAEKLLSYRIFDLFMIVNLELPFVATLMILKIWRNCLVFKKVEPTNFGRKGLINKSTAVFSLIL